MWPDRCPAAPRQRRPALAVGLPSTGQPGAVLKRALPQPAGTAVAPATPQAAPAAQHLHAGLAPLPDAAPRERQTAARDRR